MYLNAGMRCAISSALENRHTIYSAARRGRASSWCVLHKGGAVVGIYVECASAATSISAPPGQWPLARHSWWGW
jgi:hypothetical protein